MSFLRLDLLNRKIVATNAVLLFIYLVGLIFFFHYRETNLPNVRGPNFINYVQQLNIESQTFAISDDKSLVPNLELYDPFPQTSAFLQSPLEFIQAVRKYEMSCHRADFERASAIASSLSMSPSKLLEWHLGICTRQIDKFKLWLERPPFLHPTGVSYLKLFGNFRKTPIEQLDQSLLHVTEKIHLTEFDKWYLKLSSENQKKFTLGFKAITLASKFIVSGEWNGASRKIFVYPLPTINDSLHRDYSLEAIQIDKSSNCEFVQYGLCFSKKNTPIPLKIHWSMPLFVSILIYLILAILFSYLVWRVEQQHLNANQALLFQVISHEIRTPLTSLKLSSDGLRQHFDNLNEPEQKHLMNLLNSLYDLDKIVGKTLRELKGENQKSLQNIVEITQDIVESKYANLVGMTSQIENCNVEISVFWYEICLINLIRNALVYGKQPIRVNIYKNARHVMVEVEDAAETPLANLKSFSNPFIKTKSKLGLGIGLKIVSRKMKEMNGKIEVRSQPTRFILKFRYQEKS